MKYSELGQGGFAVSKKMTTGEPTTGEIVRALRDAPNYNGMAGTTTTVEDIAADRLEQQEQRIAELEAENRLAQRKQDEAERERDAAIKDINRLCMRCKYWTCQNDEPCLSCVNAETRNPNWTWRGLPQEREGKENG